MAERRKLRTAAALAAAAALVAGCGVGTDARARPIDRAQVPSDLLVAAPTTTTTVVGARATVILYLTRNQGVIPVLRSVPAPPTPAGAVTALSGGPTSAESADGDGSPVSTIGPVKVSGPAGGVIQVDLPSAFNRLSGSSQILAAAQLVLTLTQFPTVDLVSFSVAGKPTQVPAADGTLTATPLAKGDYQSLVIP